MHLIEVPDDFRARFERFDAVNEVLRTAWKNDGVSRAVICAMFGAVSITGSAWKDPAFLVWAGRMGVATSEGFFQRWQAEASEAAASR